MDLGGIVLKVETLNLLFSRYGDQTIGLAFAIKPEATRNPSAPPEYAVNIDVYRCYWDTNSSGKKTIKATKGSDNYIRTASDRAARLGTVNERTPSQYEFEFKKLMQKKKFVFGFLTKDQYDILVKHEVEEIFISGAIIDFGKISSLAFKGQYFTFKVEPYEKDISNSKWFMPETMGVPVTQILIPCPHEWANMVKNTYTEFWHNLYEAVAEASML